MAFRVIEGGKQGIGNQALRDSLTVGVKGKVADDVSSFPGSLDSISLENETRLGRDMRAVPPLKAPYQKGPDGFDPKVAEEKAVAMMDAFMKMMFDKS